MKSVDVESLIRIRKRKERNKTREQVVQQSQGVVPVVLLVQAVAERVTPALP